MARSKTGLKRQQTFGSFWVAAPRSAQVALTQLGDWRLGSTTSRPGFLRANVMNSVADYSIGTVGMCLGPGILRGPVTCRVLGELSYWLLWPQKFWNILVQASHFLLWGPIIRSLYCCSLTRKLCNAYNENTEVASISSIKDRKQHSGKNWYNAGSSVRSQFLELSSAGGHSISVTSEHYKCTRSIFMILFWGGHHPSRHPAQIW